MGAPRPLQWRLFTALGDSGESSNLSECGLLSYPTCVLSRIVLACDVLLLVKCKLLKHSHVLESFLNAKAVKCLWHGQMGNIISRIGLEAWSAGS